MKTPDYMTYTRYKKKKNNSPKNAWVIFIVTFFGMLLFFSVLAKHLSPDVDVTIGDDSDVEAKESGLGVKRFIDDRLKMIQMEDNSSGASKKTVEQKVKDYDAEEDSFAQEMDEKVNLPSKSKKSGDSAVGQSAPRPDSEDLSTPFESPRMAKVYVGYYNSAEQARVAQGILLDSGLNVTPFIKDLGGAYTLQVGSYSSRAKADSLVTELLKNNFPARVVQE